MVMLFCRNCKKLTGFKRALGVGTVILLFLTGGLWLVAIPLYPKRCVACGSDDFALSAP